MTKRVLIDASHAEETRVVVLDGNRLEDFDVETVTRKQIKGNIYLAKVIRVEPSLQAAFVEYGGNRHGFLAFGEIHPDYYQIPVADRQRLLAEQSRAAQEAEDEEPDEAETAQPVQAQPLLAQPVDIVAAPPPDDEPAQTETEYMEAAAPAAPETEPAPEEAAADAPIGDAEPGAEPELALGNDEGAEQPPSDQTEPDALAAAEYGVEMEPEAPPPESLGGEGDDAADARERRQRQRNLRSYKIQEVIHRRQIMLIQVVKEERGNKGAALTTYLSLAGRFSVLMPNSPTGGGVSRKITSVADRRRLKEAMNELDVPEGMGLIVRTAGANRPKPEIKRDCEYLLRLWDDIRDRTMQSVAPALINEEASLIKRTIRDVYTRDVEEVLVDGAEGFRAAQDFMRMLMPAHARKVRLWAEGQPLFAHYQVENQLDAMLNPTVQLRSGGYIVINQTEALVAIDVNSGRSTRERSIEDTAVRTNLEAADEVARQVRMRDLAGLIVIDFIDMESRKNNVAVERRMKDALKNDRARIQLGAISHFGLMEMSRQRLRPSLAEASLVLCQHCGGMGHVRSPESAALHILRAIEDEGAKLRAAEIAVFLLPEIALYLFNHKRDRLSAIETRYAMRVIFTGDATLTAGNFRIDKVRAQVAGTLPAPAPAAAQIAAPEEEAPEAPDEDDEAEAPAENAATSTESEDADRKRRRRRRRGKRRPEPGATGTEATEGEDESIGEDAAASTPLPDEQPSAFDQVLSAELGEAEATATAEAPARRRRSRGGRRRQGGDAAAAPAEAETPVYSDIADIFEAAERAEAEARERRSNPPADLASSPALEDALDGVAAVTGTPEPAAELAATDPAAADMAANPAAAAPAEDAPAPAPAPAEPLDEALEGVAAMTGAPEPDTAEAGAEPAAFQPTVIGAEGPAGEKKRGWWKR